MIVGERIQERLRAKGLSQSELARRVGVSQPMVNALIRGASQSTPKLHKIARELGTSPAYLSGEVDDPDQDAPEPPVLTPGESAWIEIYRVLDDRSRGALMHIAQTMVTGMNQPTVNSPTLAHRGEPSER